MIRENKIIRNKIAAILLGFLFAVTGCAAVSMAGNSGNAASQNVKRLESENRKLTEELRRLQEKLVLTNAEFNKLKDSREILRRDYNLEAFPERPEDYIYFPVYGPDSTGKQIPLYYTGIRSGTTLAEKLGLLTESISRQAFQGYEMKLIAIREVTGKKIANIDLTDKTGKIWSKQYFPNAETGARTQFTLISSYLQNTYNMDWIDGVYFTQNGKPIDDANLPHLSVINYRVDHMTTQ